MKFIVFSVFVWALALFHMWDHRRFEDDLTARANGDMSRDWREVSPRQDDTLYLRRAFHVTTRSDGIRYGAPVGFFFFWLMVFHNWLPALGYIALIAGKWLCVTTAVHLPSMTYRVMLAGIVIFNGSLRKN